MGGGFGSAAWSWKAPPDSLNAIERTGIVRIGYAIEPPYAFVDRTGRVSGEGPETAGLVAARLHWQVEWIQTAFESLIPELLGGRFDVVAAGLFVTAQRERIVRFAAPELHVASGMLFRAETATQPQSYADLLHKRVAVIAGSAEEQALRYMAVRLVVVPDAQAGLTAVDSRLVDVLALSFPTVRAMAAKRPSLRAARVDPHTSGHCVAAAFRPDDVRLATAWDRAQANVLGTPAHLQALTRLGFEAADLPDPLSPCSPT
jgi:polar amino acid transport system substrate-binding protein